MTVVQLLLLSYNYTLFLKYYYISIIYFYNITIIFIPFFANPNIRIKIQLKNKKKNFIILPLDTISHCTICYRTWNHFHSSYKQAVIWNNKGPISPNGHLSTCAITYTQILKQPPVPIPRGRQKLSFCANR